MAAYYNEIDPQAAEWIRELIKAGLVAPGEVDERDVQDVQPSDLKGFTQCHFFGGIAVWSYALRLAGWPDERPVWTGSCPCQPFSAAGKRGGTADERHLWPAMFHLIEQCRPPVVFGEQVSSKDGLAWLDLVLADLEGAGYAVAALDTCAAGHGSPHIRQRLYWVADAIRDERGQERADSGRGGGGGGGGAEGLEQRPLYGGTGDSGGMADAEDADRRCGECGAQAGTGTDAERRLGPESSSAAVSLGHAYGAGRAGRAGRAGDDGAEQPPAERAGGDAGGVALTQYSRCEDGEPKRRGAGAVVPPVPADETGTPGPVNGFWAGADWIYCRDGKYRPVKSSTTPLASRITGRILKLRGLGNSIVAVQAQGFIEAYLEARGER